MSDENHEELSPLHRLAVAVKARLETNEHHADRHPDPNVRYDANIRAQVYRLMQAEIADALVVVTKSQVDRAVASRSKSSATVTEAAVKAMAKAKAI